MNLTVVSIESALVVYIRVFEPLAVVCQTLGMLNDQSVTIIDLSHKSVALVLIRLLKHTQLSHHVVSVLLQILEHGRLNLVTLVDLVHASLH